MKSISFAVLLAMQALPLSAATAVTFGPVKARPGESIRVTSRSTTPGGTIAQTVAGQSGSGEISITRERDMVWTIREPAADGTRRAMVKVDALSTVTVTRIGSSERSDEDKSALTGKLFEMTKAADGDWKYELDGSVPLLSTRRDIEEMKVYLNRDWYPKREVKVGDSWEFDPKWVKYLIERDLHQAKTVGTMRLRQVRQVPAGRFAVIDLTVRSSGADFEADGSEASASVELDGQILVNLETMLDEEIELSGTVETSKRRPGESVEIKLPVKLSAKKSFVRQAAAP